MAREQQNSPMESEDMCRESMFAFDFLKNDCDWNVQVVRHDFSNHVVVSCELWPRSLKVRDFLDTPSIIADTLSFHPNNYKWIRRHENKCFTSNKIPIKSTALPSQMMISSKMTDIFAAEKHDFLLSDPTHGHYGRSEQKKKKKQKIDFEL